jgi:hypothetical protein
MTWREDLVARLKADAALTSAFAGRIAFFEAARSWTAYPQLVLQEVSPGREYTHNGADGLDRPRVQFDIYAETGASLIAGEAALFAELEQDKIEQGATRFGFATLEGRSMPDPDNNADDRRILRLSLDFSFFHEAI